MSTDTIVKAATLTETDWVPFPGGELEGTRPQALCAPCRDRLRAAVWGKGSAGLRPSRRAVLCFQCYRAGLERVRSLEAAAEIDTASEARFQWSLPFEPVNRPQLAMLKVEHLEARAVAQAGSGGFAARRHRAQIAARQAMQRIASGLEASDGTQTAHARALAAAAHAAELQLPEVWLPFVMSR